MTCYPRTLVALPPHSRRVTLTLSSRYPGGVDSRSSEDGIFLRFRILCLNYLEVSKIIPIFVPDQASHTWQGGSRHRWN